MYYDDLMLVTATEETGKYIYVYYNMLSSR